MSKTFMCADCTLHGCTVGDMTKIMSNCPCKETELQTHAAELYKQEPDATIARTASVVEHEGYGRLSRLEEIGLFCQRAGYKKIGLIFCTGFTKEAAVVAKFLRHKGMEVISACCKNGAMPKSTIGVKDEECLTGSNSEIMCNPIGQALLMNEAQTDFNILMGLCVGHDTLAIRHLEGPVTVLAVKDRVTMHNPMAVVYGADSYYKNKLFGDK